VCRFREVLPSDVVILPSYVHGCLLCQSAQTMEEYLHKNNRESQSCPFHVVKSHWHTALHAWALETHCSSNHNHQTKLSSLLSKTWLTAQTNRQSHLQHGQLVQNYDKTVKGLGTSKQEDVGPRRKFIN
jgi:hypothetical protein